MPENTMKPPTSQTFKTPPDVSAEIPVTIRPNFTHYAKQFGWFRVILIVGLFALLYFRFGPEGWVLPITAAAVILGLTVWRMFRRSLTVTDKEVIYRNGLGMKRSLALSDIGTAVMLPNYADAAFGRAPRFLIGDKDKAHFVSLLAVYWKPIDMERIGDALDKQDVKIDVYSDQFTWATVNHYFPKLAPVADRHPFAIAVLVVAVIIALYTIWFFLDRARIF